MYCGNPYVVDTTGTVPFRSYGNYIKGQAHFSVYGIQQEFVDGATHINVSEGDSFEMSQEDINTHLVGVAMLQQFSLKAGLRYLGKRDEEAVPLELTDS